MSDFPPGFEFIEQMDFEIPIPRAPQVRTDEPADQIKSGQTVGWPAYSKGIPNSSFILNRPLRIR